MESAKPRPLIPSLRLDELLDELQVRLQAVLSTRDRVYSLLEAVVSLGSNLDLEVLLRRTVETAVTLADARYGAMGVIGQDGKISEFIPVGLSEEEITKISHWPEGKGILGRLITDPRPLRIADLSVHPEAAGYPIGHPAMRTFLGVPIRVRGEVYGNLYLTEKEGGGEFEPEDESVVVALAAAAGVAIENARLYEEARRQQRWLGATAEVTRRLLSGAEVSDALALITEKALEMTGADLVIVGLPLGKGERLRLEHAAGDGAPDVLGLVLPAEDSIFGPVLASGEFVSLADFHADDWVAEPARSRLHLGPTVVVPLSTPGRLRGVLAAGRKRGSMPLSRAAGEMLATFAAQAAIALQLAEHRMQAERMAVFEDRDRIARDLHDLVIQRLYATGMSLQGASSQIVAPEVADRVSRAVDSLDDTIKEIRSAIFALQAHPEARPTSLRIRILYVAQEMAPALGFAPSLVIPDRIDSAVPERVAEQLLTALREALSNSARHSGASAVKVTITIGDELVLAVRDNGVGIKPGGRRSGLANLTQRAESLDGSLEVTAAPEGGTELVWRVPLESDTAARLVG